MRHPEPGKLTCGTTPHKGKYNFKTSSCVEFGPTGNPQTAVVTAKAWAQHLLNATSLHHQDMTKIARGSERIHEG